MRLGATHPVRVQRLQVERPIGAHDHAFTEIAIVEGGRALHHDANGQSEIVVGSVIVVPPGPAHAFPFADDLRITNLYYLSQWLLWDLSSLMQNEGLVPLFFAAHLFRRAEHRRVAIFALDADEREVCQRELRDIEAENARAQPSLFWVRGAFSKLLVTLGRAWSRQRPQLNDSDFRPEIWRAIERVDEGIKEGRPFCIQTLSREVGYGAAHFSRLFRAATGWSPSDYHQLRRVQHAGHLLLHSTLSISQISARLGYCDSAHLSRFFSRLQGVPPREFRRLYGSEK